MKAKKWSSIKIKSGRLLRPRESVWHYGILVNGRKVKFCENP